MLTEHSKVPTKMTKADILPVQSRASLVDKSIIARLKLPESHKSDLAGHLGQCPVKY